MNIYQDTLLALASSLALAGGLALPLAASAQSAPQAPAAFKVILDNEQVRVFESTFAPGIVVPMRSYPRRTVYVVKGPANFKFTEANGTTETLVQEAGSARSAPAAQQSVTNLGTNEVVALIVIDKRDMAAAK